MRTATWTRHAAITPRSRRDHAAIAPPRGHAARARTGWPASDPQPLADARSAGASEPYAAPTHAFAPLLEFVIAADDLVGHVFDRLAFAHTTWRVPSSADGYVPTQARQRLLLCPLSLPRVPTLPRAHAVSRDAARRAGGRAPDE